MGGEEGRKYATSGSLPDLACASGGRGDDAQARPSFPPHLSVPRVPPSPVPLDERLLRLHAVAWSCSGSLNLLRDNAFQGKRVLVTGASTRVPVPCPLLLLALRLWRPPADADPARSPALGASRGNVGYWARHGRALLGAGRARGLPKVSPWRLVRPRPW